jgi:hypothetical protein
MLPIDKELFLVKTQKQDKVENITTVFQEENCRQHF